MAGSANRQRVCLAETLLQRLEIVPLQLRRFRLQRADAGARAWLRRVFDEEGRALGTRVEEAEDGRFALRWD